MKLKRLRTFLVLILLLIFTINYSYSKFDLPSVSWLSAEKVIINENFYLGYGLHWRGLVKPKVIDIRLRNNDGSIIDHKHHQVQITPFIDEQRQTGSMNEADFLNKSSRGLIKYIPVREAAIDRTNCLVLRINIRDDNYENEVNAMILRYSILGVPKHQIIEFDGFLR